MMRKVVQLAVVFMLALASRFTHAQMDAFQNWCQDGGVKVFTSGLPSSTMVQASYPQCKVDVFLTGTLNRASIFKDKLGTPLSNPFTAFKDGYWLFFAADGQGYDVVMSSGTPNPFPSPRTLTDLIIGAGGGGGGTVFSFSAGNLAPLFTTTVTNPTSNPVLNFNLSNAANLSFLGNVSGSTGPPSYINFVAGSNITLTPSGGNTLTIAASGGGGTGCASSGTNTLQMSDGSGGCLTTDSTYNLSGDQTFTFGSSTPAAFLANTGNLGFVANSVGGGIQLLDQTGGILIRSNTGGVGITTTTGGMALRVTSGGMLLRSDTIDLDATDAVLVSAGGNGLQLDSSGNVVGQDDMFFSAETNRFQFQKGSDFSHPTPHGDFDTSLFTPGDAFVYTMPRFTGTMSLYTGSLTANDCVEVNGTGNGFIDAGAPCGTGGGGGAAFNAITSGSNTTATMNVGSGATLSFSGSGVLNASKINGITVTGTPAIGNVLTATSTSAANWQAPSGGGAVSAVSNSDGTLTITPTTGAVVASIALGHANTWSAIQTLSGLTLSGITGSTQCLQVNTSGVVSGTGSVCGSGGGSTAWSALTNPSGNLALTMASNTTTFTFGATTGSSDLFTWTDTASNTGTGIIGHFTTAASSSEIPWQADANGNGWRVATDGSLRGVGSLASHGMILPAGTALTPVATAGGISTDSSGNLLSSDNGGAFARVCNATNGICGGSSTIVASAELVTFSATPTFSVAFNTSRIVLTNNITSFTLGAGVNGQDKTLCFKQGAGPFTVTPPSNVHGFFTVGVTNTDWNCQSFNYDLTDSIWLATSAGVINQ